MSRSSNRKSLSWLPWAKNERESGPRPVADNSPLRLSRPEVRSRFRLRDQLGSGGMGAVYRAYDSELGHEVALKLLHTLAARDRMLLKIEFRTLANMVHPNLVNLYELFVDERSCFFTMELVIGVDFVRYARAGPGSAKPLTDVFNSRLRDAARQLSLALHALHESGKLHRDVKPSNILVTEAGRIVLLDFGLIAPLVPNPESTSSTSEGLVGTVPYMPPEQAWGGNVSAASDWYSFGVTLYEAITGELPIDGKPLEIALKKREYRPTSLRHRGFGIPEDLDQLLLRLLDADPARRPSGEEVVACMGGDLVSASATTRSGPGDDHATSVLVGRDRELDMLASALGVASRGVTRVVHLHGASGIGKSSLAREFARRAAASGTATILRSRCHPQETVAFNAIDGLIDDLARLLSRQGIDAAMLVSDHAAALVKVFPALARAFASEDDWRTPDVGAKQLRLQAFAALKELFVSLMDKQPLVLWLDDVQWADEDSGMVLRELVRPPNDVPLFVLLSYRSEDRATSACLRALEANGAENAMPGDAILSIALGPLTEDDGSRLVRESLGREWQGTDHALRELTRESNGSPFFLCELGRYLATMGNGQVPDRVGLEEMLTLRTRDLPPDAQRVVEVFSVAGAPLEQRVALRAAGLKEADWVLIANLERQSMLRTTNMQKRSAEIYHHRVRDAILGRMAGTTRAKHHQSIANALLSTTNPNPVAAVDHFEAASDDEAVRRYVVAAANYASQVLAFDRAAKLYQRAIDLDSAEMERYELHRRLGLALASAGRGKEAGQAFLRAAEEFGQRPGADQEQIQQLQHKAAEQFIQTGHYREGMEALQALLAKLEVPFPRTRGEALRKATALRLFSMARGVRLPPAPVAAAAARDLQRFDALWSTNLRLSMVDHTFISYATVRCAIDALKMGEPSRMICALAFEACNSGTLPGRPFQKRADHLLELADRLMAGRDEPYERAFFLACRSVVACFRGRFRQTTEDHDAAIATLRAASQGVRWEFGLWEMWAIIGLSHMGEIKELVRRVGIAREDAEQRQDLFTARNASLGRPTTAWLAEDRPEYAIEQADIALGWAPPQYTTQHYQHYIATLEAELYRGNAAAAWDRSLKEWPLLRKHYFLMLGFVRDELAQARARAALALAAALGRGGARGKLTPAALRASARRDGEDMEKHGLPCARAWAALLFATIEHQEGRTDAAVALLRKAVDAFDGCEMQLYREGARYCLGRLLGGDEGQSTMDSAAAWMKAQAILNPVAMVRMVAPGWN